MYANAWERLHFSAPLPEREAKLLARWWNDWDIHSRTFEARPNGRYWYVEVSGSLNPNPPKSHWNPMFRKGY